jgi:pyruvate formate lyase activating enzyme
MLGAPALRVGGLTPFTSLDFPGRFAAVVHLQGCPLACPYCHSPHLRGSGPPAMGWPDVLAWLGTRRGLLDGVVFSGGEPCAQPGLHAALLACREHGFATALATSGAYPRRLARMLAALEWIGLDWKSPPSHTLRATGHAGLGQRFVACVEAVLASGIRHEIRTTYHPAVFERADLTEMARSLAALGARSWVIQEFSTAGVLDRALRPAPIPGPLLAELRAILPGTTVRRLGGCHDEDKASLS